MKIPFRVAVLGLLLGALLGCPPHDRGGGAISGRVYDWVTGAGISGATVVIGSYSGTTDLSGAYSITVPDSVSSVQGVFAAFKGLMYAACAGGTATVDPTTDPVYDIRLTPFDVSGYSDRSLSGRIYDDTAAEIANNCRIEFAFFNDGGGQWWNENDYQAGSGFAAISKAYGSNCFVVVDVKDEFEDPLFQFYLTGQDLSSDRTGYDLTQPATGFSNVTVNGTLGSEFEGHLIVPGYSWVGYAGGELLASSQATLQLYNPGNYPMWWVTQTVDADTPEMGLDTLRFNCSTLPFSGTIDLPTVYAHAAPSASVDGATISWNAGTRTLSFGPVVGANAYMAFLKDDSGRLVRMLLTSSSITFPSELVTAVLDPGAGWDIDVWPLYSPQATPGKLVDFLTGIVPGGPAHLDFQAALIQPSDPGKVDAIP